MPMLSRHAALATLVALVAAGSLVSTGCSSMDRHVFESPLLKPGTVSVVDAVTRETLWSKEIPPGQKLIVDLDREQVESPFVAQAVPATELEWWLHQPNMQMIVRGYPVTETEDRGVVELDGRPILLQFTLARPDELPSVDTTPAEPNPGVATPPTPTPAPAAQEPTATDEPPTAEEPATPEPVEESVEEQMERLEPMEAAPADDAQPAEELPSKDAPAPAPAEEPVMIK